MNWPASDRAKPVRHPLCSARQRRRASPRSSCPLMILQKTSSRLECRDTYRREVQRYLGDRVPLACTITKQQALEQNDEFERALVLALRATFERIGLLAQRQANRRAGKLERLAQ